MPITTAAELVARCKDVAENYKTLYVMGAFGAPLNEKNKARYCNNHKYNRKATRQKMIMAADSDTFGFDCVNLIKGLMWGWCGDTSKTYGGAAYNTNNVPDTNADGMIMLCSDVSKDFSNIQIGEAVWKSGHIGVYIGGGLVVESTPSWDNCVQITALKNISKKSGYNARTWTKHGKLPFVTYDATPEKAETPTKTPTEGANTVNVELTVLKKGAKGAEVKTLQRLLYMLGYDLGTSGVDGSFGGRTDKAVRMFQYSAKLTVDGVCGRKTWEKLLKG